MSSFDHFDSDKGSISDAIAVRDRIGDWTDGRKNEEGSQIGAIIAANMRIHTKAVICNGQKHEVLSVYQPQQSMTPLRCHPY